MKEHTVANPAIRFLLELTALGCYCAATDQLRLQLPHRFRVAVRMTASVAIPLTKPGHE
jgi:hypothetical protein